MRRGRIDADFRQAALADLAVLHVTVDQHTDDRAWGETLTLADRFRLTLYDAAYLELARRRDLPLATLDRESARRRTRAGRRIAWGHRRIAAPLHRRAQLPRRELGRAEIERLALGLLARSPRGE